MKTLQTYAKTLLLLILMISLPAPASADMKDLLLPRKQVDNSSYAYNSPQPLGIRYTKNHPLIIVGDWNFAPFSFIDDNGDPSGFETDVLKEIFDRLHIAYEIRYMEWQKARQMLISGKADVMLEIKKNDANFRLRYGNRTFCRYNVGIAYCNTSHSVQKLSDLVEGDTVCLLRGDYADDYIMHSYTKPAFHIRYMELDEIGDYLSGGENRYYIWGYEALCRLVNAYYGASGIHVDRLLGFPAGELRFYSYDKQLLDEFDAIHDRMVKSDVMTRLHEKWFNPKAEDSSEGLHSGVALTILLIIIVLLLILFFFLFVARRSALYEELQQEYHSITDMAIAASGSELIVINVKRYRVCNIHGNILPEGEITMQEYESRIHPDDLLLENDVRRKVDEGASEMPVITLRLKHHGKQDEYRTMSVSVQILQDSHGMPVRLFLSMVDVTDTLREQHELDLAVKEYEHVYDKADSGMIFCRLTGEVIRWNKKAEELIYAPGYTIPKDKMEYSNLFFHPFFRNELDPDDPESFHVCNLRGIPEIGCFHTFDYYVQYVRDRHGKPVSIVVIFNCIDEQRAADREYKKLLRKVADNREKLENTYKWMRFVMEKSNIIPFIYDLKRDEMTLARDRVNYDLLVTAEEYKRALVYDLDEDADHWSLNGMRQTSGVYHTVRKVTEFAGEKFDSPHYISLNAVPEYDEKGRVIGRFGLAKDITDFVLMQKHLRQETEKARDSFREKSTFLANMTHEFHTPLSAIRGFADVLLNLDQPKDKDEYLEVMRSNSLKLIRILDNVIRLSDFDTKGLEVKTAEVEFSSAFREACERIFSLFPLPEGVSYKLDIPEGELRVNVDFARIMQIVEEFVSNASKYTKKGAIAAGYRLSDGFITIFCKDTGIGIPKDKHETIFDRFVKVDDFVQGAGLGLAVAKTIADYIGGEVSMESEVGKGSVFMLKVKPPHPESPTPVGTDCPHSGHPMPT